MSKTLVLLLGLVAMAALSDAARDLPAAYKPEDYFYDNPWIPPIVRQIAAPYVPYLGPNIGYPPSTPSPPAAGNPFVPAPGAPYNNCGPFIPPVVCAYLQPHPPPAAPATPSAPAPPHH